VIAGPSLSFTLSPARRSLASRWTWRSLRETGRRFQFCVERFQIVRRLFLQRRNSRGSSAGGRARSPRGGIPDLVGSRLPGPYHFRARIQSFQAVAAPFPGNSALPSASRAAIPATAAWELRNQPKSNPLCRSPSAGGLYVISIGYKTFRNRSLHFSRCLSSKPAWNTAPAHPRIGKALRASKTTLA
jgi:hypothetical protein